MTTTQLSSPASLELLKAIDQLETSELRPFVSQVLARAARRLAPHVGERESELLEEINRSRSPETERRFRELIAARQAETLSSAEMEELIDLTEEAEAVQAERTKRLLALAKLRGVSLPEIMAELDIEPLAVE